NEERHGVLELAAFYVFSDLVVTHSAPHRTRRPCQLQSLGLLRGQPVDIQRRPVGDVAVGIGDARGFSRGARLLALEDPPDPGIEIWVWGDELAGAHSAEQLARP